MEWARMLAYVTGTVDQELLLRNVEGKAAEAPVQAKQLVMPQQRRKWHEVGRIARRARPVMARHIKTF